MLDKLRTLVGRLRVYSRLRGLGAELDGHAKVLRIHQDALTKIATCHLCGGLFNATHSGTRFLQRDGGKPVAFCSLCAALAKRRGYGPVAGKESA